MEQPVALITGAARRLGACTAATLHRRGYRVIIHYHRSGQAATELVSRLNHTRPDSAVTVSGDLVHGDLARLAEQALDRFGQMDLLVNNASSFYSTPLDRTEEEHWVDLLGTNAKAPLMLSRYLAGALRQRGGNIINMIDIHAQHPLKHHTVYCMAKAALAMMTRSLAKELAPQIRVNGVAPGAILWPETAIPDDDKRQAMLAEIPLQRTGTPRDIADTIAFLALDAPYITGQIIAVDGGRSL